MNKPVISRFSAISAKGDTCCDFFYFPGHQIPSEMGSALKDKNLLPKFISFILKPFSERRHNLSDPHPAESVYISFNFDHYLSIFSRRQIGDISNFHRKQLTFHANGDNLQEMLNSVFWEK